MTRKVDAVSQRLIRKGALAEETYMADKFFICVFSAFRKETSESSGSLQMGDGKLNVA